MTVCIVCVGNRFVAEDALGPRVLERLRDGARLLAREPLELIDGGLLGLDLLSIVERASHVVFVDALTGAGSREVVELRGAEATRAAAASPSSWGHDDGLAFLLRALPHVCDAPPSWELVGAEGVADDALVDAVAARALVLAREAAGREIGRSPEERGTRDTRAEVPS
jgi:hydrogenase maturation protease